MLHKIQIQYKYKGGARKQTNEVRRPTTTQRNARSYRYY